jgi:hypothetical protein
MTVNLFSEWNGEFTLSRFFSVIFFSLDKVREAPMFVVSVDTIMSVHWRSHVVGSGCKCTSH